MKRFTATEKWAKGWFRQLPPRLKCLWNFLCENSDCAGVWEPDFELASFQIGEPVNEADVAAFGNRVAKLPSGKFHLTRFIEFQYGKLSPECRPHLPVFKLLQKHGIEYAPQEVFLAPARKAHVSESKKLAVIARDGGRCLYCGGIENLTADHVVPRAQQGGDEATNLVAACEPCNRQKSDKSVLAFIASNPRRDQIIEYLNTLSARDQYPTDGRDKDQDKEKDREGMQGERPKTAPRNADEVKAFAITLRPTSDMRLLPDEGFSAWFFDANEKMGWTEKNGPIRDWKAAFRSSWRAKCHKGVEADARHEKRRGDVNSENHKPW